MFEVAPAGTDTVEHGAVAVVGLARKTSRWS